jgi:hypothetical protein
MLIKDSRRFTLSRRALLRSGAGVAVALPMLEAMIRPARADSTTSPKRAVVMFGGVSTGRDYDGDAATPSTFGADYALTRPLMALAAQGVKNDVGVISNLEIGFDAGSGLPAGGRGRPWHSSSVGPLLSGRRASSADDRFSPLGPTIDQLIVDAVGGSPRFRSLEYKVQASGYRDETSGKRIMSYRAGNEPNEPITSTRVAWEALFSGFVPTDPAEQETARRALAQRRSVLDLVRGRAERLRARLGRADNQRLERHFDELRALETRLLQIDPSVEAACIQLDRAGGYAQDPAIQNAQDQELCRRFGFDSVECRDRVIGYAEEHQRGRLLADLVHMAFICDQTRVATIMLTHAQSFMNVASIVPSGVVTDAHELGHGTGTRDDHADMVSWHVDQWAYLVKRLKETPEPDGSLLDHTALALVFEGGFGFDPEGNSDNVTHSSQRMITLVAGAGLRTGHIDGNRSHPAQALLGCARAVGYGGALGDFTTPLPGLLG